MPTNVHCSARFPLARHMAVHALLLVGTAFALHAQNVPNSRGAKVDWLRKNAAPIRTVDPADDDYSDLDALGAAIGNSSVVMLGEQSHGDGAVFLAKTRIIKYLHEKHGFDVLAFESGLYDVPKAWEFLRTGEAASVAVRRGVFGIWTGSSQFQPLIEYIGKRAQSDRPLEITGFDNQFTATASREFFQQDLRRFLITHRVDTATIVEWSTMMQMLTDLRAGEWHTKKPSAEAFARFIAGWTDMKHQVDQVANRDSTFAWWKQLLVSTEAYAKQASGYEASGSAAARNNIRDLQMGENLLWLVREKYPDRKIIVWAATFHNMRNPGAINTGPNNLYRGLVTMGHVVSSTMGNRVYSLGFIASEGRMGIWRERPRALSDPSPESLEGLFASTKHANAFLDFRRPAEGGAWLRNRMISGPLGYAQFEADWTRVLDGMIYTRKMTPSTKAN